ncbi:interferon gamma receptor 1-like [Brachyistius frenatus]|uniref:interferon gamma receptor 1-like n=1 Tax=Brachyistius frenatus TaxID=100188 RepID=UPI0037E747A1
MGRFHPVSLLLIWIKIAAALVDKPTDVTLRCQNLINVLEWSYGQIQDGLRFRVDIRARESSDDFPPELWVEPPALEANLSFLSNPQEVYFVTVTAVIGENESVSSSDDGISFSYTDGFPAIQKCFLDLPSVNVIFKTADTVLIRFEHPWLRFQSKVHGGKKSRGKQICQIFKYDLEILNQTTYRDLECEDKVCEALQLVDAAQENHCLRIEGKMLQILVKTKQEYCRTLSFEETSHYHIYISILVPLLLLIVVSVVIYMIIHKKIRPSTSLPPSMIFKDPVKKLTMSPDRETITVLRVTPSSPTPLMTDEEDRGELTPVFTSSNQSDFRLSDELPPEVERVSDDIEAWELNYEKHAYQQGSNLEEDEALSSGGVSNGYESRRPVLVNLAPDELNEGYRNRGDPEDDGTLN